MGNTTPYNINLPLYLAWVNAWLSSEHDNASPSLSLNEQAQAFLHETSALFPNYQSLKHIVNSFRQSLAHGQVSLGGKDAPTCAETNLASGTYNPNTTCTCTGLYPIPAGTTDISSIANQSTCTAIHKTITSLQTVLDRPTEWNTDSLCPPSKLTQAVTELLLANSDIQPFPTTCQSPTTTTTTSNSSNIPPIRAPDRRPDPQTDTPPSIHQQLYPTTETLKFCVDAKHYVCAGVPSSPTHDGLIRAIADAGNDILIADYCEVADPSTLHLLQQTGAAAVSFLKLCVLAGVFSSWAFDNMILRLPDGIYGSHMTDLIAHRYIDLGLFFAVAAVQVWTGEQINEAELTVLSSACTLINDLVDLRSDSARKQRENVYLDQMVSDCLETASVAVQMNRTCAVVVMAFCNWAVMSSHHKVWEVSGQVREVKRYTPCEYGSVGDRRGYQGLLAALEPFGTLGMEGPSVRMTRAELDIGYGVCKAEKGRHLAWLADITRSLLQPETLRRIVDVVHFGWTGSEGDVEYCP
ncbi:hypothetical protein BO78DRAFT_411106 [Aspergillus sclerotiicarbonarius CBS 121057]|uniref:Uncharacterized protein n=1 Tax=Aspergillus sclerotiicarbonarius (strain CBS 121057 / IBT 28362) TaxID=1448318 RepID=A0A319DVS2_ASPSB|nr:hypothetical protein BO78DRAFT_411106 [Aspergillus sclerotiicarbonarius CBS 121057]